MDGFKGVDVFDGFAAGSSFMFISGYGLAIDHKFSPLDVEAVSATSELEASSDFAALFYFGGNVPFFGGERFGDFSRLPGCRRCVFDSGSAEVNIERFESRVVRGHSAEEIFVISILLRSPADFCDGTGPGIGHVFDVFVDLHVLGPQVALEAKDVMGFVGWDFVRDGVEAIDFF